MKNPCYKCEKRYVGCHDKCEIPERVEHERKRLEIKEQVDKRKQADTFVTDCLIQRNIKMKK